MRAGAADQRWSWVDLRLVPVAATVWAVAAGGAGLPPAGAAGGAPPVPPWPSARCCSAGGAPALLAARGRASWRRSPLAAAVAAVRARHGTPPRCRAGRAGGPDRSPWSLELDDDPHVLAGAGAPRVVADATVTGRRRGRWPTDCAPRCCCSRPAEDWAALLPGQSVRLRVAAALPRPGRRRARGAVRPGAADGASAAPAGCSPRPAACATDWPPSAARTLPDRPAGLLPGPGGRRHQRPWTRVLAADFRRAGLSHLTAVSGANVAIVVARRAVAAAPPGGRPAAAGRASAALALVGFVVLARPEPACCARP